MRGSLTLKLRAEQVIFYKPNTSWEKFMCLREDLQVCKDLSKAVVALENNDLGGWRTCVDEDGKPKFMRYIVGQGPIKSGDPW